MESLKGYRTLIFNLVSGLVATAGALLQYTDVIKLEPYEVITALIIVNMGNAWLRLKTDSPVGKKY